jgi:NAD(P)H-quinone oxidoreductase subunit 5
MNEQVLTAVVVAPGLAFLLLALAWMLGWTPQEKTVARVTALVSTIMVAGSAWMGYIMLTTGQMQFYTSFGDWFRVHEYEFTFELFADRLSLPLVGLTSVLVGIVGSFSVRYMHKERGYFRFFMLLLLFAFGSVLAFTAGSFDLLIGGWELVGVTSVLLVAFFSERREPVRNALRVFATYRIADIGLLMAVFAMHYLAGSSQEGHLFLGNWPAQKVSMTPFAATIVGLLLLWGAAGKSAQFPFSGWLPRAMEGPTPSSAIFYGAISVHLGAYLLLRAEPVFVASPVAAGCVVIVGALTALLATLTNRVVSDAKTTLSYAAMSQLGIIFMEIGLGFPTLALMHLVGHAVVRTLQFLRAPSMLRDYRRVHAAAQGEIGRTGEHYEGVIPAGLRLWLYRFSLERGFYDSIAETLLVNPVLKLSRGLAALEPDGGPNRLDKTTEPIRRAVAQEVES